MKVVEHVVLEGSPEEIFNNGTTVVVAKQQHDVIFLLLKGILLLVKINIIGIERGVVFC